MAQNATVLFDGVCHLCSAVVRFIIANDPHARFRFAALDSAAGAASLARFGRVGTSGSRETLIVIDESGLHERSAAALRIAGALRRPWCWLAALERVPLSVRDHVYRFIAARRYRWFGRRAACLRPEPAIAFRFLTGGWS